MNFIRKNESVVMTAPGSAAAAVLLGSLLAWQPASGQDASNVTVNVEQCLELDSEAARRDCITARVDEALEERGAGERASRQGETASTQQPQHQPATEARRVDRFPESDAPEDVHTGTIVTIRERLPSAYVITLDNGQIWEQVEPKRYPLRPGLEVRIVPTNWGQNYRLSGVDSGGHIQVRRVR